MSGCGVFFFIYGWFINRWPVVEKVIVTARLNYNPVVINDNVAVEVRMVLFCAVVLRRFCVSRVFSLGR